MPTFESFVEKLKTKKKDSIDLSYQYPMLEDNDIKQLVKILDENHVINDIKKITLSENNISDAGVEELLKIPNLETLRLSMNDINDQAAITLYRLKNLELLEVSTNNITDEGAKGIGSMETLLELDITNNNITDEGSSYIISNLSRLKSLRLSSSSFGDKTIQAILSHSNLEEVIIFDDENIDSEVLGKIKKHVESNREINKANKAELTNNRKIQFFQQSNQSNEEDKNNLVEKLPAEDEFIAGLLKLDVTSRKQYLDRFIERINNISSYDNKVK